MDQVKRMRVLFILPERSPSRLLARDWSRHVGASLHVTHDIEEARNLMCKEDFDVVVRWFGSSDDCTASMRWLRDYAPLASHVGVCADGATMLTAIQSGAHEAAPLELLNVEKMSAILARADARREFQFGSSVSNLTEQARRLDELMGALAHRINNPLSVVAASLEFALDEPDDPESIEALKDAREQIERATRVLHDLSTWRTHEDSEHISIAGLARECARRARSLGATVELSTLADGLILAPPRKISRCIDALIQNAIDAIDSHDDPRIWLISFHDGGLSSLTISDNGRGMSPQVVARAFEPFFSTRPKSLGLGLSMAGQLAKALGGKIDLESRPGSGTTVTLALPRVRFVESQPPGEGLHDQATESELSLALSKTSAADW